jgi:hypothetical protein
MSFGGEIRKRNEKKGHMEMKKKESGKIKSSWKLQR